MIVVIIPMLFIAYLISPLFLPRWRWENMSDWDKLAQSYSTPKAKLQQTYQLTIRYNARGDKDPCPWQVISSQPLFDPENDPEQHLVRVNLISDRTGEGPSKLHLGSGNYRDLFFKTSAWRFPPGAFGQNKHRPVIIYDASTFDKLSTNEAYGMEGQMKSGNWTNDDEDVDDGFKGRKSAE